MKVYHDLTQTMVQLNIWEAFHALELESRRGVQAFTRRGKAEKKRGLSGAMVH
jgi:hypothetical protein